MATDEEAKEENHETTEKRSFISCDELMKAVENNESKHQSFHHYTSLDNINNILSDNQFRLKSVRGFNDDSDKDQYENPDVVFASCFCTGRNEDLPLWYFYGGLDGKGGRISIGKKGMDTLKKADRIFSVCDLLNSEPRLLRKSEFEAEFHDVIYYKESDDGIVEVNQGDNIRKYMESGEFDDYYSIRNGFCKEILWDYEKEFRISVKITDENLKNDIIAAGDAGKDPYITMLLDDVTPYIRLRFAPEIKSASDINEEYEEIKKHRKRNTSFSKHKGKVHMNLCAKCAKN